MELFAFYMRHSHYLGVFVNLKLENENNLYGNWTICKSTPQQLLLPHEHQPSAVLRFLVILIVTSVSDVHASTFQALFVARSDCEFVRE